MNEREPLDPQVEQLLTDLRFLEELELVELDIDDTGMPHWSPTEKGRAMGTPEEA